MKLSDKIKFSFGTFIIVVLAIMNLVVYTIDINTSESDLRNSPPTLKVFQNLLYNKEVYEYDYNDIFSMTENNVNTEIVLFVNKPAVTAQTGKKYTYKPNNSPGKNIDFWVESGPSGLDYDGNYFQWVPDSTQTGTHKITLVGEFNKKNIKKAIEFTVYVDNQKHYLGTDNRGRSLHTLIIAGARWSLIPGLIACVVGVLGGMIMGGLSGYYDNFITKTLVGFGIVIESVPALILIFLAAVISRFNIYIIMCAVGLVVLPSVLNNIRSTVKSFIESEFVESSKEIGFSNSIILWRDIIWNNCKPSLINNIAACMAFAVIIEVTLSYLQIGIQSPSISWGSLLYEGKSRLLAGEYWMVFFPSTMIVLTLLAFFYTGETLSKKVNPRYKK